MVRSAYLFAGMVCLVLLASLGGTATAGALSFAPPVDCAVDGRPADIAIYKDTGAPNPLLAVCAGRGVSILHTAGWGRYTLATRIAMEHRPVAVAVGLLDERSQGTSAAEAIITANTDDTVSVIQGDGTGRFVLMGTYPTGAMPLGVAVGDATGDGHADVVTADWTGGGVSILAGDGTGHLSAPTEIPVGESCARVVCADFNSDGTADIAASRYSWEEYGGVRILLSDGAGGFTPAGDYNMNTDASVAGMVTTDLNHDRKTDLVFLYGYEGGRIHSYLGDGLGLFLRANEIEFRGGLDEASGLAVADMDGDGTQDIVSSGYTPSAPPSPTKIYILRGIQWTGAFQITSFFARRTVGALLAADLNGDRKPDLAWSDAKSDRITVRLNGSLPVLTGVLPARGRTGTVVTLTGSHFLKRHTVVSFAGQKVSTFLSLTASRIRLRVPAGTPKGRVNVTVTTLIGRSGSRSFTRL